MTDLRVAPENSFHQLRLRPIEMLRRVGETFPLLLEVSNGGHKWQVFTSSVLLIPVLFFPIEQLFR